MYVPKLLWIVVVKNEDLTLMFCMAKGGSWAETENTTVYMMEAREQGVRTLFPFTIRPDIPLLLLTSGGSRCDRLPLVDQRRYHRPLSHFRCACFAQI